MKIKSQFFFLTFILVVMGACIGDDFVDDEVAPTLRITTNVDTIMFNSTFQFEHLYLNNIGKEEEVTVSWASDNMDAITIDNDGLATAHDEGEALISVSYLDGNVELSDERRVVVGANTIMSPDIITGSIKTTSSYKLEGDFSFEAEGDAVRLSFDDSYSASTALPGLYVYLSNNANSVANALEVAKVEVFDGAHEYLIPEVGIEDYQYIVYYCKPFNVKVGDGSL